MEKREGVVKKAKPDVMLSFRLGRRVAASGTGPPVPGTQGSSVLHTSAAWNRSARGFSADALRVIPGSVAQVGGQRRRRQHVASD